MKGIMWQLQVTVETEKISQLLITCGLNFFSKMQGGRNLPVTFFQVALFSTACSFMFAGIALKFWQLGRQNIFLTTVYPHQGYCKVFLHEIKLFCFCRSGELLQALCPSLSVDTIPFKLSWLCVMISFYLFHLLKSLNRGFLKYFQKSVCNQKDLYWNNFLLLSLKGFSQLEIQVTSNITYLFFLLNLN